MLQEGKGGRGGVGGREYLFLGGGLRLRVQSEAESESE